MNKSISLSVMTLFCGLSWLSAQQKVELWYNGSYQVCVLDSIVLVGEAEPTVTTYPVDGYKNDFGYVDLGLPSGLKWATYNLGAIKPEEHGDYFSWGEAKTKSNFSESSSFTYERTPSRLEGYGVIDSQGNLLPSYDAATSNWGDEWRMPTRAEYDELIDYCDWSWTDFNGVKGYKVTSKSNSSKWIFFSASGYYDGSLNYNVTKTAGYWSTTVVEDSEYRSWNLSFDSSSFEMYGGSRDYGNTIRPVTE